MQLLLIRHGQTAWNQDGRYQGRSDPPLSAPGEHQARALAQRLTPAAGLVLVASPLQRAQATAQILGTRLGRPVATDPRLIELDHGAWEGLLQTEVKQRWPGLLRLWKRHPEAVTFPGGESLAGLQRRVRSFLDSAAQRAQTTVAVTHAGVARMVVLEVSGAPLSAFRAVQIDNASLTTLDWRHGRWTLATLGDVAHLAPRPAAPA